MRIRLTLHSRAEKCLIPINYQYPLSAAIYRILSTGSAEYGDFLHEKGYLSASGKPLKLFTFSYLYIPNARVKNGLLCAHGYPRCSLQIASPLLEDFIQNFIIGLFSQQEIVIGSQQATTRFSITAVESLPMPTFAPTSRFKCLSPFVASTMREKDGHLSPYYYRPDDAELSEAIRNNLVQKFTTVYQRAPASDDLTLTLDQNYLRRKGGAAGVTKLITIKEDSDTETTRIKAIYCPFTLAGSIELMQVACEAGLGAHCSQGFGMIEMVK